MPQIINDTYVVIEGVKPRVGSHSTVRKVTDISTGKFFAIKFFVGRSDDLTTLIFEREVSSLKKAVHPHIVPLVDSGIDDTGTPYIVLPWSERTFEDVLLGNEQGEPLEVIRNFIQPIVSALSHLHLLSIEHRDIKPANILIADDGTPYLADFSIGKLADKGMTGTGTDKTLQRWRTNLYAPPEADDKVRFVRDIFSLGALLAVSIADHVISEQHEFGTVISSAQLPQTLRDLFGSCVDFDPSQRPTSGAALNDRLSLALSEIRPLENTATRVWIELTTSARSTLTTLSGGDPEEHFVLKDLATSPYAAFSNETDQGSVTIVGDSLRCVFKADYTAGVLRLLSVKKDSFEALEWWRRKGIALGQLATFRTGSPLVRAKAQRELAEFLTRLQSSLESHAVDPFLTEQAAMIDRWKNQLDAREELARSGRGVLSFVAAENVGNEIRVKLLAAPEDDLLNSLWELKASSHSMFGSRVEVIKQSSLHLTLRWRSRSVSPLPAKGILTPNLGLMHNSLLRQRDAVRSLEQGKAVQEDLLALLTNPERAAAPAAISEPDWITDIDTDKKAAVRAALGLRDVMVVKGPPGTGKTRLISEIVAQTLSRDAGSKILLVSQTHVAVDNALERLDQAGVLNIVRLGRPEDARISKSVSHLLLDEQMSVWAAKVRLRAENHMNKLAQDAGLAPHHLRAASTLVRLSAVSREQETMEKKIISASITPTIDDLTSEAVLAEDTIELQDLVNRLQEERALLISQANEALGDDLQIDEQSTLEDLDAAVSLLLDQAAIGHELLNLLSLQADWLQRVFSDSALADTFLQTTNVVAGTCIGFLGHPAARHLEFDLCILDEASKATATESLVPLVKAKKMVFVGDTHQLPPLDEELLRKKELLNEFELTEESVKETLFERLSRELPTHSQFQLSDQHRMTRAIGDLISSCFYDGQLNSLNEKTIAGYGALSKPVLWVDTSAAGNRRWDELDVSSNRSFVNRMEADVISRRLRTLDNAIEMGLVKIPNGAEKLDTLLIAPYRSQLDILSRSMAEWTPNHLAISIESVDAVQGREADIAFFSVTRSNNRKSFGFLGPDYWRRVNVALSRARFGLVIVGDAQFCRESPGPLADVANYVLEHSTDCEMRASDD